ncbi:MAG: hypothetical protein Q4A90_01935 [Streptococcus sp.]|nr:hypothetical protein [Streptococcus sp.]
MSQNGKLKTAFLVTLCSESATILGVSVMPSMITNVNNKLREDFGDPSSVGFGWGIILIGWVLYIPIFLNILLLAILYTISIVFRIRYSKAFFNNQMGDNKYLFLFTLGWVIYLLVPIILLGTFFASDVVVGSVLFMILDVSMLYFTYLKRNKIDS